MEDAGKRETVDSAKKRLAKGKTDGVPAAADRVLRGRPRAVPLIFEESAPRRRAHDQPRSSPTAQRVFGILGRDLCRDTIDGFPELSEPQVVRHFLRLSQLNFGQALNFYPLGSCTMKYNPVVNEEIAGLAGFVHCIPIRHRRLRRGRWN